MRRKTLLLIVALLAVSACQGKTSTAPGKETPTPANVAVQPGDAPTGMARCEFSGSIDHFLDQEQVRDPDAYTSTKKYWDSAKAAGATAAHVALYVDQEPRCAALNSTSDVDTSNFKLIINYVIQFKDEPSAVKGYRGEIFGFNASQLMNPLYPGTTGAKTGLGPNSVVITQSAGSSINYIAEWQTKVFLVVLFVVNFDATVGPALASAENSRIV